MSEGAGRKDDLQSQWARVRGRLREEFGDAAYRSWLKSMTLYGVDEGRVRIGVPTRFLRDWVTQHYAERIRALWNAENEAITSVEILVTGKTMAQPADAELAAPQPKEAAETAVEEKDISAPLDPRCTYTRPSIDASGRLA